MLEILIENGHERNRNAGDEAHFCSMIHLFRQYLGQITITAFSDRPHRDQMRYGVRAVYSGGTIHRTLLSFLQILKAIKSCDVYVWGGGQLLRDDTGIKSPLYRLSRPFLAKIMGKSLMAYAIGVGPLEMITARFLVRRILNKFNIITVRDANSLKVLERIGVSKPEVCLTVDPAFGLETAPDEEVERALEQLPFDHATPIVGVAPFGAAFRGVRSLLPAKYQIKSNMWQPGGEERHEKHVRNMAQICDHVVKKFNAVLVFVAQDISWQGRDNEMSKLIISHMSYSEGSVIINADDYHPEVLMGIMERMTLMIGGRMHSLILASAAGTPVLGICFEDKIRQLGGIIRQMEFFIDAGELEDVERLYSLIDKIWSERSSISEQLRGTLKELRVEIDSNVQRLARLL